MNGWREGLRDGWMDGWMDGWIDASWVFLMYRAVSEPSAESGSAPARSSRRQASVSPVAAAATRWAEGKLRPSRTVSRSACRSSAAHSSPLANCAGVMPAALATAASARAASSRRTQLASPCVAARWSAVLAWPSSVSRSTSAPAERSSRTIACRLYLAARCSAARPASSVESGDANRRSSSRASSRLPCLAATVSSVLGAVSATCVT